MPLPYVHKVTKYDPSDWKSDGRYVGPENESSDHGPREAAYLVAVEAFAQESGVTELSIREPAAFGPVKLGLIAGEKLAGLSLSEYHDGVVVPLAVAVELVRDMLRDSGAWCRLEADGRFAVHIGWDQYMYIGSHLPCDAAVASAVQLGLFPVRLDSSPWDVDDEPGPPADAAFWTQVAELIAVHGTALLCESPFTNHSRWHRLTADFSVTDLHLAPRARLTVWPDLSTDLEAVRASVDDSVEYVWENPAGVIQSVLMHDPSLKHYPPEAVAAAAIPLTEPEYNPLLKGVLIDPDGVLRARWSA
ncbi:hypothetical protein [Kribbella sp. NPDC051770]|uniref:hypothetical protein n=1 Tax=Kribbella sp. NPDC051770 TaxID=3155413 RepID=UPI003432349F